MKFLLVATLCLCMLSFTTAADCKLNLKIGARIPVNCLPGQDEESQLIATHPSQLRPYIKRTVSGIEYIVAYDEDTRRIKYIQTNDKAFRSTNGLQVGAEIKVSEEQVSGGCCGWYTFGGRTPDGWDIIIADDVVVSPWQKGEIRIVMISGFKKGGN